MTERSVKILKMVIKVACITALAVMLMLVFTQFFKIGESEKNLRDTENATAQLEIEEDDLNDMLTNAEDLKEDEYKDSGYKKDDEVVYG